MSMTADFWTSLDPIDHDYLTAVLFSVPEALEALLVSHPGRAWNHDGNTLVHFAAKRPRPTCLSLLIHHGYDIHARNTSGRTPLFYAANHGFTENIALLIEAGADVDATDLKGSTPALSAIRVDQPGGLRMLAAAGANLQLGTLYDIDSLALAIKFSPECLDELLSMGVHLRVDKRRDPGLMHIAVQGKTPSAVASLIAAGVDTEPRDYEGKTAIHHASAKSERFLPLLVAGGAHIEARDVSGATPLMIACSKGLYENARCLLSAGADITPRDHGQLSAIDMAHRSGKTDIVELILAVQEKRALQQETPRGAQPTSATKQRI